MSLLRNAVEDYLTLRRALGFKLRLQGAALRRFASFLEREGASTITTALALRWAKQLQHVQPAQWATRLSFVRTFARYWSATDPQTEIPPLELLPFRYQRPMPHIYSDDEIQRLLIAAKNLPSPIGLRPWTYATLFGLLSVTGLRVGEAIALNREDVDLKQNLLTLRFTKFRKSRLVPIHRSTTHQLRQYVRQRDKVHPNTRTSRFFVSDHGKPLTDCNVRWTFVKISRQTGLREPAHRFGPRLHDLRHRFAVTTFLRWYRMGVDVEQRLPTLSTYLGHAHVTDTYWYLSAVPELLALTKTRLEKRWETQP